MKVDQTIAARAKICMIKNKLLKKNIKLKKEKVKIDLLKILIYNNLKNNVNPAKITIGIKQYPKILTTLYNPIFLVLIK